MGLNVSQSDEDRPRILTVPDELDEVAAVIPTGNLWVSLPDLPVDRPSVPSLTVLHDGAGGLLELRGGPLWVPRIEIDDTPVADTAWELHLQVGLLPRWQVEVDGCRLTAAIACPPGHRGFVAILTAVNAGERERRVTLAASGRLAAASLHVFTGRSLPGPHRWWSDRWTSTLRWELTAGLPVLGMALRADDGASPRLEDEDGFGPRWTHRRTAELPPAGELSLPLYLGVGREADGAALATVDLARHGAGSLLHRTRRWLEERCGPALPGRPELQAVRDRNRLFCLTFAAGRAIDTEELALVTSRSPRYYVSGAHWTRDSLLWAFPAVVTVDLELAADWLRAAFGRYARNPGTHALYLDGGVLYPGFELDEVAAFLLALDHYLAVVEGHDADPTDASTAGPSLGPSLLDEPAVRDGLRRVDAALAGARDGATGLYATFLLASDDPAPRRFVTASNALAVAALRARARIHDRLGDRAVSTAAMREADRLWAAMERHMVVDGPFGSMFCGATDAHGDHVLFDEPPGSLELLAHHGVVDDDDPRFLATVRWIHSSHNPHGPGPDRYATPSCEHADHPWLLAVGNALLRGETRWLELVPELPLDQGYACETFDAETGEPRTGLGFATCAGRLAHAIDVATGSAARDPREG